jgi:hypothetical protein
MSVIDLKPATSVVVLTNARGRIVTHAYFARPELMMIVVATHKATAASSWFATPNIGQIVEIEPDQINAAQAGDNQHGSDDRPRQPRRLFEFLVETPAKFTHQKTRDTRARVDRREE